MYLITLEKYMLHINHYCLNCFCAYSTKNKLEAHKTYVKIMIIVI